MLRDFKTDTDLWNFLKKNSPTLNGITDWKIYRRATEVGKEPHMNIRRIGEEKILKIFVSYSKADAYDFAFEIRKYLEDKGHDVYIEKSDGIYDLFWSVDPEENISNCDIFVVILTRESVWSSDIKKEVLQAQRAYKIIIPCIHNDVKDSYLLDYPNWGLEKVQGIEFSDKYELVSKLSSNIEKFNPYENLK